MTRVYNFSSGPAVLPESVLKKAADELPDYQNTGMSVMEMSHRSGVFMNLCAETEELLISLMKIPSNYRVLFLQGGASLQFTMIPMNIMTARKKCDIIHTGVWTEKAIKEAERFGKVNIAASSGDRNFSYIPDFNNLKLDADADYVHICYNNTICGTKYNTLPATSGIPIVADMSSCILSEPYNVTCYGLIFAGAQKNIGPAGLTIVIIRKDLMERAGDNIPSMLDYRIHAENRSLFNTPPTFTIYMAKLVFEWLRDLGGVDEIAKINRHKAGILYDFIDNSKLFMGNAEREFRSMMNVTFTTGSAELDTAFWKEAEKNGLSTLQGHKSVGGLRASIYNAMPLKGVKSLIEFMKEFETRNG